MTAGLFGTVARHDLAILRRDRLASVAMLVLVTLLGFALWSARTIVCDHRASLVSFASDIATKQDALGGSVSAIAVRRAVVLPDGPLSILSLGRSRIDPSTMSAHFFTRADQMFVNYQTDSPMALASGTFDVGFVTIVIVPLVVIALGYGVLSAERDSGRLRLLLATGARARSLLVPRLAVRAGIVAAPVVVAATLGVILVGVGEVGWLRLGWWLAAALTYMALWWSMVALGNALRLRAEAVAAGLLTIWAVTTLLLPTLAAATANAVAPPPSRASLSADTRRAQSAILADFDRRYRAIERSSPRVAAGNGVEDYIKRSVVVRLGIEQSFTDRLQAFDATIAKQQKVARAFAWLSPALSISDVMLGVAGTDQSRFAAYRHQALAYKSALQADLFVAGLSGAPLDKDALRRLPPFGFREPHHPIPASFVFWILIAGGLVGMSFFRAARTLD